MWTDMEAADPAEIERARVGLEVMYGVKMASTDEETEVVVRVSVPAGLRAERAHLEMRDGALLVHLPRHQR